VSAFQAANLIVEKEGAHTADRPRFMAGSEMMSGGMRTLLMGVGDRLRKYRKYVLTIQLSVVYID